jgi:sigma-B regulation protein RsbU (phosphoserine phosphatase)
MSARILVVDDEAGMLRAVERVLGSTYQVVGTASSTDALSIAVEFNPDLALVDIRMPDVDGFELMARLKGRFPDLDIILMTGSVDDLDEKLVKALRSPAFYFIQKPFDREVLRTLVERCLELRRGRERHRRNVQRLETEMAAARAFQRSLLPEPEAILNGLALACRYTPSDRLGGDLYDYAATEGGDTALLVADVSGHGVSAAMLTGVVKSAFRASHADGFDPLAVVQRVSSGLAAFSAERFVTLFAGLITTGQRQLRYVNAGHPPILLWGQARGCRWLHSTGPMISPVLPGSWVVNTEAMDKDDQLLLYTDGVSDVLGDGDESFESRLEGMIEPVPAGGTGLLDAIVAAVHAQLDGAAQPDDVTLLTARVI